MVVPLPVLVRYGALDEPPVHIRQNDPVSAVCPFPRDAEVAVGHAATDVDVLVRIRGGWREQAETALALEDALGRRVQLIPLDHAPPLLLEDVLREGRVLADRDGDWARLKRRSRSIARAARDEGARLEQAAWDTLDRFAELVA